MLPHYTVITCCFESQAFIPGSHTLTLHCYYMLFRVTSVHTNAVILSPYTVITCPVTMVSSLKCTMQSDFLNTLSLHSPSKWLIALDFFYIYKKIKCHFFFLFSFFFSLWEDDISLSFYRADVEIVSTSMNEIIISNFGSSFFESSSPFLFFSFEYKSYITLQSERKSEDITIWTEQWLYM